MSETTSGHDPSADFDPFAGPSLLRTAPSTEPQREIWTACRMGEEASLAFNESGTLHLEGPLDPEALRAAVRDLVARHEALRSTLSADGLTLLVAAAVDVPVPLVDLSGLSEAEQEGRLAELLVGEVQKPFDLESGPLARFTLVRMGETTHRLVFTAHHIVCDGWSTAVLMKDLGALYSRRRGGNVVLSEAASFSAYARAEAEAAGSREFQDAEGYWLRQFAEPAIVLDLPGDRPRPPLKTYASRREDYPLPADLVGALKKVGARAGASFFMTLLAGFKAVVHRLSGQEDVVVGIPAAGQSVGGHESLVGHCVNTLPLRSRVAGDQTFEALVRSLRTTMLDAYEHQQYTYGTLLRKLPLPRDPSRLPLVSVLFNVDQALTPQSLGFAGLKASFTSNPRRFETFDLFVNAVEHDGQVVLEVQYNTDLFDAATVRRWLAGYEVLLRGVVASPVSEIAALPVLTESDRIKLAAWNATETQYPRDSCIHELIEERVARGPERPAITFRDRSLSYGQLNAMANRIARALRQRGVTRGTLVGLFLERSPEMIAALLGVLKAGGAYVPLDPAYPVDRLAHMIADSGMPVLVSQSAVLGLLPQHDARVLCLDDEAEALAGLGESDLGRDESSAGPEDPAYVIYTSGSTGRPKGVQVPHRAVVNFLSSVSEAPGLGPADTLVAVTTLSFDIAVLELQLPLVVGARIVLADRDTAGDGAALAALVSGEAATVMQATPATWRMLLAAGWRGGDHFTIICGGEAMPRDLAQELVVSAGSVWNMYGPTETTVWSTREKLTSPLGDVTIGRPLANTQVHVLDSRLQPVPIGVPGELHIGGDGVTLGYLNRPELTAERFVADPTRPGGRLYKTGDLARFRPDGRVEYLGRNDNQVKVRGFRIELGEIETALARHPDVAQAVVAAREFRAGDVRLVAYLIPSAEMTPIDDDLRRFLRKSLPEYMLPQHYVALSAYPLTPNGKVDRKALPAPMAEPRSDAHVEPRNDAERLLAQVLQDALGVARLSVHDNFFHLGGHSLLAAQVLARLAHEHRIALGLRDLFESPTVESLARLIERRASEGMGHLHAPIPRRADQGEAPASLMQQRLGFLEQLAPGQSAFNVPSSFRLRGRLDIDALERALNEIVRRHASIRTTFRWDDSGLVQVVAPELEIRLKPLVDLEGPAREDREVTLRALLREKMKEPFDLVRGPLFRVTLYRLDPEEHVLSLVAHHMVWDGWSFDIYRRELDALYGAFCKGLPSPLAELPTSYGDFAAWQRQRLDGPSLKPQVDYWTKKLGGSLEPLDLPGDHPRPAIPSDAGDGVWVRFTRTETDALTALARRHDSTLFMLMLAAFKVLLYRHSGQRDVRVGAPVRARVHHDTQDLIGFFVNTLVLRSRLDPSMTFADLLASVRTTTLEALGHEEMPFELLLQELRVRRDLSRAPIAQHLFSYQEASGRSSTIGDLKLDLVPVLSPTAQTDLTMWLVENREGLSGALNYSTDLFEMATTERMLGRYRRLLESVLRDPRHPIGRLDLLPVEESAQIAGWNDTTAEYPSDRTVCQIVTAQAARAPERVAVDMDGVRLTYQELERGANRLARRLRGIGVERGSLVGLCVERSPQMVVAMQGILRAGGAYVPLDPSFPAERLAFMVRDSGMAAMVTEGAVKDFLPESDARLLLLDDDEPSIDGLAEEPIPEDEQAAGPEDVAYVLYTSGSTGRPKGVMVSHRALSNFLSAMSRRPGFEASDRIVAVTTLSFDISALELHLPLTVGASVVLASGEVASDGIRLRALLEQSGATLMQATPATWRLLIEAGWQGSERFRALCGGEALPRDLGEALLARAGEVWNMYGPTETTVWSTCWKVEAPLGTVLIGTPIDNTSVYVLDEEMQLAPIGVPGELFIGGDGVALGYFNRPELTAERFVPDPFRPGRRMYRTGDRARFRGDGNLEFLGRNDHQVKVRGYRIELGEIETTLREHDSVSAAVVAVHRGPGGEDRLLAYVVPRGGSSLQPAALRKLVRSRLPEYMVPSLFVALDALPLTPNGKIDRKALPEPQELQVAGSTSRVEPRTTHERLLADVWSRVLGVKGVGAHDNFFDLGGHSLLSMRVILDVERETGHRLSPRALLFQNLEQVAQALGGAPEVP